MHHTGTINETSGTTAQRALDALLRRNPAALVAGLRPEGVLESPPAAVELHGQQPFDFDTAIDLVAPEDQVVVLDAWARCATEPTVSVEVRLLADDARASLVHFFDLRADHGVHVVVLEARDPDLARRSVVQRDALRTRVGRIVRDGMAVFVDADEATTALLGWTREELVGRRSVDLVHPDDVERAMESWMAMRAGVGSARIRVRYRHALGHHVWLEVTNDSRLDDPEDGTVVSELVDVTAEMDQLEALRERERLLARLAEALPIGVCHLRADRAVVYVNAPLTALLGPVECGDDLVRRVTDADRPLVAAALNRALLGRPVDLEVGIGIGIGQQTGGLRCELTFRPLADDAGGLDGVIVCAADVTDRSRLRAELEHRANHDALSGCLNRAATVSVLEETLATTPEVALAFIDLDDFKAINDELGHATGDGLLRVAASRLRATIRSGDRLGRIGGDEFVVIFPVERGRWEIASLIERLTAAVNVDVVLAGRTIALRASVGVAFSTSGDLDAHALLERADSAMYAAKRGGDARDGRRETSPIEVLPVAT